MFTTSLILIRNLISKFFDKKTSIGAIMRNMFILMIGTAGAQVISFAAAPIITRIYSPADFGVLSVFSIFLAFMGPFITMQYSGAIPLPRRTGTAVNLMALCMVVSLGVSVLSGILLWFLGSYFFAVFSAPELTPFAWVLVLGILGGGLYETLSSWATREKQFKIIAKTKMTQSLLGSIVKIGFGLMAFNPLGLLIGSVVSQTAGVTSIITRNKVLLLRELSKVTWKRIYFLANRYFDFPKFRIPSRLLLVYIQQAPLIAMATYFDIEMVGQLGFAFMVIALPATLVINSVSQTYYADIAKIGKKNSPEIYKITKSISLKMFFIGLLPCSVLLFFGPYFFELFFGKNWGDAGRFSSILSILLLFRFVSSPIIGSMVVLEKQQLIFIMNIVISALTLTVFLLPILIDLGAFELIKIYVSMGIVTSSLYSFLVLRTIKNFGDKKLITPK